MNDRGHWNRAGRRSGGDRPARIIVQGSGGPFTKDDAEILLQRERIRAEFGEEGVRRFDEELLKTSYPHEGGCEECRERRVCNVCGGPERHCTNGRCRDCHNHVCTEGGDVAPGHALGTREDAISWLKARTNKASGLNG